MSVKEVCVRERDTARRHPMMISQSLLWLGLENWPDKAYLLWVDK